jgi:hypothetical protein
MSRHYHASSQSIYNDRLLLRKALCWGGFAQHGGEGANQPHGIVCRVNYFLPPIAPTFYRNSNQNVFRILLFLRDES